MSDTKNEKYEIVFDKIILRQLKRTEKNKQVKDILSSMLDKIEEKGPNAGSLLDTRLKIYEMKSKHPPIRIYYKHNIQTDEIYVFEYEMKTSEKKQKGTINKIRDKISRILGFFV